MPFRLGGYDRSPALARRRSDRRSPCPCRTSLPRRLARSRCRRRLRRPRRAAAVASPLPWPAASSPRCWSAAARSRSAGSATSRPRPPRWPPARPWSAPSRPATSPRSTPPPATRSCRSRPPTGPGTGFVVDADGTIVTNAHVVGSESTVQVQFADDETVQGRVERRRPLLRPRGREGLDARAS